tara:strand:- start:388 stop:618 length:231 start_codon:yes stop_codon:yes gene_type:complete
MSRRPSLDFVTTDEILKELKKRFDDFIIVGSAKRTSEQDDYVITFKGTYHGILGLCELGRLAAEAGGDDVKDDPTR